MSWFKVDDKFHASKEVKSIPREQRVAAIGLWTLAGAWSSDHLSDGFIPTYMIEDFAASTDLADALVKATLWTKRRDGYTFRNWAKWQQTREEVEAKRAAVTERVRRHRAKNTENSGDDNGDVTRYERDETPPPSRPVPTRDEPLVPDVAHERSPQPGDGTVQRARRNPTGIDEPRVVARLEELVGSTAHVSVVEARLVAEHFIGRAKGDIVKPTAFVLGCITKNENTVANFIQSGRWSE
jgi:hypothetical protein